jgi:hypothetical protein
VTRVRRLRRAIGKPAGGDRSAQWCDGGGSLFPRPEGVVYEYINATVNGAIDATGVGHVKEALQLIASGLWPAHERALRLMASPIEDLRCPANVDRRVCFSSS